MLRADTDLDLLDQFLLYEAALKLEDGQPYEVSFQMPDQLIKKLFKYRLNASESSRKSKRFGQRIASPLPAPPPPPPPPPPSYMMLAPKVPPLPLMYMNNQNNYPVDDDSSSSGDIGPIPGSKPKEVGAGVTPGLRRRREKSELAKKISNGHYVEPNTNGTSDIIDNTFGKFYYYLSWLEQPSSLS